MKSRLIDEPQSWGVWALDEPGRLLYSMQDDETPHPACRRVHPPCAARAQSRQADWRRDGVDERVKAALTSQGWRLEDDGRALEPKTKAPVTKAVLEKAVLDLRQGARRAALETVNLMLASGKPLSPEDKQKIETLSADLPPVLVAAILDPRSDMNQVKAMVDADLSRRRLLRRRPDHGRPRGCGTTRSLPGRRGRACNFPTTPSLEKSDRRKDPSPSPRPRSAGIPSARPSCPPQHQRQARSAPIIIEDQNGAVVAQYDIRRRAIVLDRESVLASVVGTVPPRQAFALRASLRPAPPCWRTSSAHPRGHQRRREGQRRRHRP